MWWRSVPVRTGVTPLSLRVTAGGSAPVCARTPILRSSICDVVASEGLRVPPLSHFVLGNPETAVHDARMRVADEAVAPLLQPQREALRSYELHARENAIEAGSAQMEIVNIRAVADNKAVRHFGVQLRNVLAVHGEADRETRPDRPVDGLH